VPYNPSNEDSTGCYENYTMFSISSFQYIVLAFVYSKSKPYRKPIWTNFLFCITLLFNSFLLIYIILYPARGVKNFFELVLPPDMTFRYWMVLYGCTIFLIHLTVENCIVENLIFKKFQAPRENNVPTCKRKYVNIENELQSLRNWPEVTDFSKPFLKTEDDLTPKYTRIKAEQRNEKPKHSSISAFFELNVTK